MPNREMFTTPLEIDIDLLSDQIKCMVFSIDQETDKIEQRLRQLRATKLNLQLICSHKFQESGHTHGGTYETCQLCGHTQKQ